MSIMQTIFGAMTGNKPQEQQQQAAPNGVQSAPNQVPTAGNGVVPNNSVTQATGNEQQSQSPMDAFKDLWQTDPNAANNNANTNLFNVDPAKLQAAVSKADFTKSVSPDLLKKVAAGGDEAVAALQQVLNGVAANTFSQQTMSTTKILEQALAKQQENLLKQIPDIIKQQTVSESLKASNPLFSNPAVAPMLDAIQMQMQVKFPTATAAEIKTKSEQYLSSFADMLQAPQKQQQAAAAAKQNEDWTSFFQ